MMINILDVLVIDCQKIFEKRGELRLVHIPYYSTDRLLEPTMKMVRQLCSGGHRKTVFGQNLRHYVDVDTKAVEQGPVEVPNYSCSLVRILAISNGHVVVL